MKPEDDGTLYDRWLGSRDGDAFAELARRHSPVAFDLACRVLDDRAGAEDVLQEALLALALERTRKPVEVGVVAWLARFAICRARNRRASERARFRRQIAVGLERPEGAMPDESLEVREELERALGGCDPEDRALLAMRFLHGWDYDRIAAALSIREGAARVRVHRALEAVRSKAGTRDAARVAPALAALPVAVLPESALDGAIRTAVELAKVRLGAPPNGVEHATAASRSFRVAVTLSGAAVLFVSAAGVVAVPEIAGTSDSRVDGSDVADLAGGVVRRVPGVAWTVPGPAPVDEGFRGVPRPLDWDLGTLRRVATGEGADGLPDAPAPAARDAAPAPPPPVLAAADREPARDGPDDPPSALRPTSRAACAANGEPVSPDGERAGALGGSSAAPADAAPAPREDAPARADDAVDLVPARPSRGTAVRGDALPAETQALLGEAEALLREFLAEQGAAADAADATTVRKAARKLRKQIRRGLADGVPGPQTVRGPAKRARAAYVRQVLTLLTEVVLSDGRAAGDLRWPSGARLDAALAEVIRVLETRSDDGSRLPSGAPATDEGRGLPSGAGEDA